MRKSIKNKKYKRRIKCSSCGFDEIENIFIYCPNCGNKIKTWVPNPKRKKLTVSYGDALPVSNRTKKKISKSKKRLKRRG